VDDIARGTILAVQSLGYEIINLGGGQNLFSLQQVIALIETALGKKATVQIAPLHPADVNDTWADIAKAQRLLGWSPQISVATGFARAVQWHSLNRAWLKTLKV
jgi:nucleoside-diphosphate-sugar epimerase